MKVAVYAIALNEERFARRWAQSAAEADYRVVLDTGSHDETAKCLRAEGVVVSVGAVRPWRFDDARNASLSLVPPDTDICIALDMDEVLCPGWRDALEAHVPEGVNRPRYRYVWSWLAPGVPDLVYHGDKIHRRGTHRWKHPVHEVLACVGAEAQGFVPGLEIHHHPDPAKSRSQYLPLLELAVAEDPGDDRNLHYLGREYLFAGRHEDALRTLQRHLDCPRATWPAERAASLRYVAEALRGLGRDGEGLSPLLRATQEAPGARETWLALLQWAYRNADWALGLWAAERALAITEREESYLTTAAAWGPLVLDLGSVCAWRAGAVGRARDWCEQAIMLDPTDTRLHANLQWFAGSPDMDTDRSKV